MSSPPDTLSDKVWAQSCELLGSPSTKEQGKATWFCWHSGKQLAASAVLLLWKLGCPCRDMAALQAGVAMHKLKSQEAAWFTELQVQDKRKS